uniref:Ig-like domain-containing protein n=1 Tax=Sinocyclocheilus grahami TaxID=75366 RepID=A0A672M868_SINGR
MTECVFGLTVCVISVSLQDTLEAVIGGSVILPCSLSAQDLKLQDINVHWRQNGSKIVYDIVKGEDSVALQDSEFKNRAESFPDEYLRGNFSIKLNNLQHTDAGTYSCYITHSYEPETTNLLFLSHAVMFFFSLLFCCRSRQCREIIALGLHCSTCINYSVYCRLIIFCWEEEKKTSSFLNLFCFK